MNMRFAHRAIGPVNHACWLTLAIRLQSAYILTENPSENSQNSELHTTSLCPLLVSSQDIKQTA